MKVHTPDKGVIPEPREATVFLAGSIEMGKAENWQQYVIKELQDEDIVFYNPRRPDWDSSWKQDRSDKRFVQQVEWELDHLEKADIVAFFLAPETVSPISLLELGMYMHSDKVILCCPEGFARKGNVDITASRYDVTVVDNIEEFVDAIRNSAAIFNGN